MFLHIMKVDYLGQFKLRLFFNNGVVKDVDLASELYGTVFEPLQNLNFFQQVTLDLETQTVTWPSGADFAPEFLYEIGEDVVMQESAQMISM